MAPDTALLTPVSAEKAAEGNSPAFDSSFDPLDPSYPVTYLNALQAQRQGCKESIQRFFKLTLDQPGRLFAQEGWRKQAAH